MTTLNFPNNPKSNTTHLHRSNLEGKDGKVKYTYTKSGSSGYWGVKKSGIPYIEPDTLIGGKL